MTLVISSDVRQTQTGNFLVNSYPKKAVRVLREDCMPAVVCVSVRHSLYPCPQELVPQQGSVRYSICRGREAERVVRGTQTVEK